METQKRSSVAVTLFLLFSYLLSASIAPAPVLSRSGVSVVAPSGAPALLGEANRLALLDNWMKAAPLYEQAEELFRKTGNKRDEVYARLGHLFATSASPTDLSNVLHHWLRSPIVKADLRLRLWCLALSGYADLEIRTPVAKQDWIEALAVAETIGDSRWAARAMGELGIIAYFEGNAARAVSLVGRALLSLVAIGDPAGEAELLAMIGYGFIDIHRFAEAHWFFHRAISVVNASHDGGFPFNAEIGEAVALAEEGHPAQAAERLNVLGYQARLESNYRRAVDAEVALSEIAMKRSNFEGAKKHLQEAIEMGQTFHLYRVLAPALLDLAVAYRTENKLARADGMIQAALSVSRSLGDRSYVPRELTVAAELKFAENKPDEADRLFRKAERIIEELVVNQHSKIGQAALAGAMGETYLKHFHLVEANGNVARAFALVERIRGRVAATSLSQSAENASHSSLHTTLESSIAALQLALLRTNDPNARTQLEDNLVLAERKLAYAENETNTRNWNLLQPVPLKLIRKTLRKDELLIEYVLDEPNAFAIAVTREAASVIRLPAGSKRIEELVRAFLETLKAKRTNSIQASELHALLVEPITNLFGKPRLIIVPDGALYFLPFEALQTPNGDLMVSSNIVSYSPSGSTLWVLRQRHALSAPRSLLAVGDVNYEQQGSPKMATRGDSRTYGTVWRDLVELAAARLHALPESRREVLSIVRTAGPDAKVLLGPEATESAFKAEPLSDYRVIHLAVHAISDSDYPDRSALVLAPDVGTDDGLLQVREIARLHLRADLVTLSACKTAVGLMEGEAGVISLEQSFLTAGAKAVVASLWNVEDESTTTLMETFYRHLARHEDKATALAHAKRDLLAKNRAIPAYYWAGFVIAGEASSAVLFQK